METSPPVAPRDRAALRNALITLGRAFSDRGWLMATAGNLSARIGDGSTYTITGSGIDKGALTEDDFVDVRVADGERIDGVAKPSAESVVHAEVYRATAAELVVHVHSPSVTLVSRRDVAVGSTCFEGWELLKALGFWSEGAVVRVPVVPNHGDLRRLGRAVGAAISAVPGVLVAGHGLYAWGASAHEVRRHVEAFEALCQLSWEWERRPALRS